MACSALTHDPSRVLEVPAHRQFEKFGTFVAVRKVDIAQAAPILEVARAEERELAARQIQHHYPLPAFLVPEHFGIAVRAFDVADYRVLLKLRPGAAAVRGVGDRLREGRLVRGVNAGRRVD